MLGKRMNSKSAYSPYSAELRKKGSKAGGNVVDSVSFRASVWLKELPRRDGLDVSISSLVDLSSSTTAATLKRPTSLSRHASAAGFPLSPAIPRGLAKGHKPHSAYSPNELGEGSLAEAEDITQLLADVACFAERLEKLKDVVLQEDGPESRRSLAHECLGEALRILRQIISKYPLLNTLETLTAAGTLISRVKGFHYESNHEAEKREFEKAVEMIAVSFSSTVSEFLMGEVDSSTILSIPLSDLNQSVENLYGGITNLGPEDVLHDFSSARLSVEEVNVLLQRCDGGVDFALKYSKSISKYMKDLIYYMEKRTILEIEFSKGLQKIVNTCKQTVTQEPSMPFLSIYSLSLEQDMEYSLNCLQAATTLRTETYMQPLSLRRLEHEKRRKEIKEQWHRAQRKLQEAENNLRKAKQMYMQRSEECDKARHVMAKAEEDQMVSSNSSATLKNLDKKRRLEEEARNKAEEAMATYRTCIADANTQKQELEDTKVTALRQLHEVVKQSDQVIKSATISFYQIMHMQTAPLPVYFQTLCESSKLYDPGQQYASHVKRLQLGDEPETQYDFEPYVSTNNCSPVPRARKGSYSIPEFTGTSSSDTSSKDGAASEGDTATGRDPQSRPTQLEKRGGRGHQVHKSWPPAITETKDSLESPATSPGEFPQMPSNGSLSPKEEPDGNSPSFEQSINEMTPGISTPTGPFRHISLSRAAQTHRLRKLRTPSKCRECNSYVYFQGAECEECYLACHKKCLETLAIQCGHKKLQGKLQLFGRDFAQASHTGTDGIPFIVKKCINEIERRAMKTKLPEPIMPFRMYNSLMGLAKETLQSRSDSRAGRSTGEPVDTSSESEKAMVTKLKELLKELPGTNLATLKYIMQHLKRIIELEDDNKMSSSNLGIVFGPTLMRPRPTQATISLSSLVDYPHQACIVEALINFYATVFESSGVSPDSTEETIREDEELVRNQEDEGTQPHSEVQYLEATSEQTEAALDGDSFREPDTPFIDSDSDPDPDPEDGTEAAIEGIPQANSGPGGSETSGEEESPFGEDASEEGVLREIPSVEQSDPEDTSPLHPLGPAEGCWEAEGDAVFRSGGDEENSDGKVESLLVDLNTNQSNNSLFSHLLIN
ncbi:PREDICTED: minor histocompatibility protein HA-1 [Thamnophis sirtalis]|uniref:Minor histocompatibility protein HA-1 n=1 Tax=Thamnophis sirtalis TaxID=35019 RepID=A0A6I9Y386_9SAUR|nr:PREDICTED: minor histocompatibility protein HA-1 [Thamnophis sirtalis]